MDVEQTNQFADFVEKNMFQTPLQIALVKDIRAGVYSNGDWALAKISLITALLRINAPEKVLTRAKALQMESHTQVEKDELIAAAQSFFASRPTKSNFVVPTITPEMLESANENIASMLIPDSNFMDELTRESDERIKRIVTSDNSSTASVVRLTPN